VKIAVLTCVRDRLDYTQHCFGRLKELAGHPFDHYVLDQASTDGVTAWLRDVYQPYFLLRCSENLGISRGMNQLLTGLDKEYDVVVKVDNDCELVQEHTLETVADLVLETGAILSPRILGLNHPPQKIGDRYFGGEKLLLMQQIGGIFLAAPGELYRDFRYSESNPLWGGDDLEVCAYWNARGYWCGYVDSLEAWHYEGTSQQYERYPEYYARRVSEGGPR
jgi:hypothetical protein